MTSLGIDVGGSSVKLASIDETGQTLWQTQSQTYQQPTREQLAAVIRKAVAGRFLAGGTVGICVPGTRDLAKRTVIQSVNLPALNGLQLDELVADSVGGVQPSRIEIMTDANATGVDIYAVNRLSGRLCSLALGTGIGAAVIDEGGVPLAVDGESPGHIGQLDVSIEGEPVIGPDGGAGSLEGYLGAPAIVRRYGPDMARNLANFGPNDPPMKAPRPRHSHLPRDVLPAPRRADGRDRHTHEAPAAGDSADGRNQADAHRATRLDAAVRHRRVSCRQRRRQVRGIAMIGVKGCLDLKLLPRSRVGRSKRSPTCPARRSSFA
jgi:hypothetical protein